MVLWFFGFFLTWSTIQLIALRGRKRELPVSRGLGIYRESTDIVAVIEQVGIQECTGLRVALPRKGLLTWTLVRYFIAVATSAW